MSQIQPTWKPREAWRQFRLEAEATQHYPMSYSMYIGQTHHHVLLDEVLPALLQIKATAILDDAPELGLLRNGHALVKPYKDDLNGRLTYLEDHALLPSAELLHDVRKRRNALAHDPGTRIDWNTLKGDVELIERAWCNSAWRMQPACWRHMRSDRRCKNRRIQESPSNERSSTACARMTGPHSRSSGRSVSTRPTGRSTLANLRSRRPKPLDRVYSAVWPVAVNASRAVSPA